MSLSITGFCLLIIAVGVAFSSELLIVTGAVLLFPFFVGAKLIEMRMSQFASVLGDVLATRTFFFITISKVAIIEGVAIASSMILVLPFVLIFSGSHSTGNVVVYGVIVLIVVVIDYRLFRRGLISRLQGDLLIHRFWRNQRIAIDQVVSEQPFLVGTLIPRVKIGYKLSNGKIVAVPGLTFYWMNPNSLTEDPTVDIATRALRLLALSR